LQRINPPDTERLPPVATPMQRDPGLLHPAFVALAALLAHGATLGRQLVWDDLISLEQMKLIGGWRVFSPDAFGFVRPGKVFLFSLLRGLFGEWAPGWQAFGLAAIVAAALMLHRFARVFLSPGGALVAALVYAVHPLHVEGAGWASAVNGTVLTVLALGYYLLLLRDAARPTAGGFVALTVLFLGAILMKEEAVVLPLVGAMVLAARSVRLERRALALFGLHLALAGAFIVFNRLAAVEGKQNLEELPFAAWVVSLAAPRNVLSHFLYFLAPFRWGYYTAYDVRPLPFVLLLAVGLIAAGAFVAALARARLRPTGPLFFLSIAVVALLPASNLIPLGNTWFGVRYLSHAGVGLALLMGWGAARLMEGEVRWARAVKWATAVWLVAAVVGSALFHRQWRNEETLFATLIEFNDDRFFNQILASHSQRKGRHAQAEAFARRAVELEPDALTARVILGMALKSQGRIEEAVAEWRRVEAVEPLYVEMAINMAVYHEDRFERDGAKEDLAAADRYYAICMGSSAPDAEVAFINRGRLWAIQGKLDEAIAIWEKGLTKFPGSDYIRRNLERAREDREKRRAKISGVERPISLDLPN
jgi:tetratricopeptide (TPR) repeat protein